MTENDIRRIVREEMLVMVDALIPRLLDEVHRQIRERDARGGRC